MSSSQGYYFEYQLSHDNSILPARFEPYFEQVDVVYCHTRVEYILKKRSVPGHEGDDEETLDSFLGIFHLPWNSIIEMEDDFFHPAYLTRAGANDDDDDDDAREGLVCQLKDFANQIKADPINAGCTVFPILVSIQVYTVQQENEAIDAARERAITSVHWLQDRGFDTSIIISMDRVKVEVDDQEQEECCICLNKPRVGEEIWFLKCLHAYHSNCIINWLEKNNSCPLCRAPVLPN